MHLALRSSSVIHPGTMYDVETFLTIRDLVPPCNPQHRVKLWFHPEWTGIDYAFGAAIAIIHCDRKDHCHE